MWRLKVASGENPWLFSLSDHPGRQIWEFETNGGTEAERKEVERLREGFKANRKHQKHSSDAIMRLQVRSASILSGVDSQLWMWYVEIVNGASARAGALHCE